MFTFTGSILGLTTQRMLLRERLMGALVRHAALGALAIGVAGPMAAAELDLENNVAMVLTPTRLRQSLADVPGSVTVITADMIERFGIRSIPDALRFVPGMAVTQVTGNDYRINYHGTNILVPRRMNVLVDGMSAYGLRIARVDWNALPVVLEDIDRIEVIRGSNSASYGSNSMLAIINIITKHPKEVEGAALRLGAGSLSTGNGMARYGGKFGDASAYRISLERQQDQGFDYASTLGQGHDSSRLGKLNFRSVTDLSDNETLDLQASIVQGVNQIELVDSTQKTFPDVNLHDNAASATWKKSLSNTHAIQVQAYITSQSRGQGWRSCLPAALLLPELLNLGRANARYAGDVLAGRMPSGGTKQDDALAAAARAAIRALGASAKKPICLDTNQDLSERRYDAEFQDTAIFSDTLRAVNGVGIRYDYADSNTFFGGKVQNKTWRAFSNVEYKPTPALNINAGGFLEKDDLSGFAFSPRLALNTHISGNSTLRFVLSKALRMPDMLEQRANWTYPTSNYSRPLNGATEGHFYRSAIAPGNLSGEKIFSKEIGYLGNFSKYGIVLDAKIFEDKLEELISEKLQSASFLPTNNNSAHLRGAEMQLNYAPNERWMLFLAYSYLANDASTVFEQSQYAKNSGALGFSGNFANGWKYSLAYYGYGADTQGQKPYGREDLTLSKGYKLGKDVFLTPTFSISHLNNRSAGYFNDIGLTRESRYDSNMKYFAALKLAY